MKQWEYLEGESYSNGVKIEGNKNPIPLNILGKQGWELVTRHNGLLTFKREVITSPKQNIAKPNPVKKEDDITWGIEF